VPEPPVAPAPEPPVAPPVALPLPLPVAPPVLLPPMVPLEAPVPEVLVPVPWVGEPVLLRFEEVLEGLLQPIATRVPARASVMSRFIAFLSEW